MLMQPAPISETSHFPRFLVFIIVLPLLPGLIELGDAHDVPRASPAPRRAALTIKDRRSRPRPCPFSPSAGISLVFILVLSSVHLMKAWRVLFSIRLE